VPKKKKRGGEREIGQKEGGVNSLNSLVGGKKKRKKEKIHCLVRYAKGKKKKKGEKVPERGKRERPLS